MMQLLHFVSGGASASPHGRWQPSFCIKSGRTAELPYGADSGSCSPVLMRSSAIEVL